MESHKKLIKIPIDQIGTKAVPGRKDTIEIGAVIGDQVIVTEVPLAVWEKACAQGYVEFAERTEGDSWTCPRCMKKNTGSRCENCGYQTAY